jgi:hypothetical protein
VLEREARTGGLAALPPARTRDERLANLIRLRSSVGMKQPLNKNRTFDYYGEGVMYRSPRVITRRFPGQ